MSAHAEILRLREQVSAAIVGQREMVDRLIIGLLANGNLLVEGLPGLAKTRAVKALAKNLDAELSRIQFTPDLLRGDVTGTEVYYTTEAGAAVWTAVDGSITVEATEMSFRLVSAVEVAVSTGGANPSCTWVEVPRLTFGSK